MDTFEKRNEAIAVNGNTVNGRTADLAITAAGSDVYWTLTSIMGLSTILFLAHSLTRPRTHRIFHYITASITMVATIAYFSMGSNLGYTPIAVEFHHKPGMFREIFYVRYIDWFITTPLLLMDLLLTAGMPWPTILWVILVDWVMIVCGLVGALVTTRYKWGYFTFGCAALFYIIYVLGIEARASANRLGSDVGRVYLQCGALTLFLWILYPIAWGVAEGGNVIHPDSEAAFYSVLDALAKPVFGAFLLWGHRDIDPARLGLRIRDYDEDPTVKGSATAGGAAAKNGAVNKETA
ncbi:family A G protein-coupled receptor-like protein [Aulographum hederae CBS 113979]|uniref:Family A G protein-coupled receptor-like protein n=1 Tax=Aulographum hederae CBS 113979 TaxID=1176131 RepID=A0A6G1GSY3_9PEZI|nr:family A G protein-coupled receptor-like protein [Aulographum hederae CBS 113979]